MNSLQSLAEWDDFLSQKAQTFVNETMAHYLQEKETKAPGDRQFHALQTHLNSGGVGELHKLIDNQMLKNTSKAKAMKPFWQALKTESNRLKTIHEANREHTTMDLQTILLLFVERLSIFYFYKRTLSPQAISNQKRNHRR